MLLGLLVGAASRAHAAIYVNEFMANNTQTIRDDYGRYSDWVELFNHSPAEANLGGYYLSDSPTAPAKWRIPTGTKIPAGSHLLIWCDGTTIPNPLKPLHASFKMSAADGEWIALYAADGATTVDAKLYGQQAPDVSYGRIIDTDPTWVPFAVSTPRAQNIRGVYIPPPTRLAGKLFINEWLTSNTTSNKDPSGRREDWLELYNATNAPIDLGGYYLTDDLLRLTRWRIPFSNVIGPKGFALFWADKDTVEGLTHAGFRLSDKSGDIRLSEKTDLVLIDQVHYGPQRHDVTQGRLPDGAAPPPAGFPFLAKQTPRSSNYPRSAARAWGLYP